jgi:hypothetical protein
VEIVELVRREVDRDVCEVLFCDGRDEEGGTVEVLKRDRECGWIGGVFEPVASLEWRGKARERKEEGGDTCHIGDRTGVPSTVCWWKAV